MTEELITVITWKLQKDGDKYLLDTPFSKVDFDDVAILGKEIILKLNGEVINKLNMHNIPRKVQRRFLEIVAVSGEVYD